MKRLWMLCVLTMIGLPLLGCGPDISKMSSIDQLSAISRDYDKQYSSDEEEQANTRWDELSRREIRAATTYGEANEAYRRARNSTEVKKEGLDRLIALCGSTAQCKDAYDYAKYEGGNPYPPDFRMTMAHMNYQRAWEKEAAAANSFDSLYKLLLSCPFEKEEQVRCTKYDANLIDLIRGSLHARLAYEEIEGNKALERVLQVRWCNESAREFDLARTLTSLQRLGRDTAPECPVYPQLMKKWRHACEIADTRGKSYKELQSIYALCPKDTEEANNFFLIMRGVALQEVRDAPTAEEARKALDNVADTDKKAALALISQKFYRGT